jgi:AraC-like DNA-binding protein
MPGSSQAVTTVRTRKRIPRRTRASNGRLPSSTGGIARLACHRLTAAGLDTKPLLKKAGLTGEQIDQRARLPVGAQIEFLNLAADALNDSLLGFHLAHIPDFRQMGLFYYVFASSSALKEVFERGIKYSSLVNDGIMQTTASGGLCGVALKYVGVSRHVDCHIAEFWITAVLRICRHLTGRRLVPQHVRLTHHRQAGLAELTEYFGTDVEFGASADEIAFDVKTAELPVVTADPHLNKILVTYCEEALAKRKKSRGSFQARVENTLVPLLPHGKGRADEVARHLGVSQRTFARRLALEDLTFTQVLEKLRTDLADRYLADRDLSVSQIAWLLGYREVGAFSHAFKRWTGKTPREARARLH